MIDSAEQFYWDSHNWSSKIWMNMIFTNLKSLWNYLQLFKLRESPKLPLRFPKLQHNRHRPELWDWKTADSNFSFSLILNPIEVFSVAMERSLTLLQLILNVWYFFEIIKSMKKCLKQKLHRLMTCWEKRRGQNLNPSPKATNTATHKS